MIKAISKYILFLVILLLGLSSQLSAYSNKGSAYIATSQSFNKSAITPEIHIRTLSIIFTSRVVDSRENLLYDCSEEKEDDDKCVLSHKKKAANLDIFSTPFYNSFTKLFSLLNTSQALHFGKHFSQYPLNKLFIVFSVFRI